MKVLELATSHGMLLAAHSGHVEHAATSSSRSVVALALIVGATVIGGSLAGRAGGGVRRKLLLAGTASVLLVIACTDLLPQAWAGAGRSGMSPPLALVVTGSTFLGVVVIGRLGCVCAEVVEVRSGAAAASALALHRFLEGAALVASGPLVAVALAAHALLEGMAVGTLLGARPRQLAAALAVMCIGPIVGAGLAEPFLSSETIRPFLVAAAAGVLLRVAYISLRSVASGREPAQNVAG